MSTGAAPVASTAAANPAGTSAATSFATRSCSRMYSALVGTHFANCRTADFSHIAASWFCHGEYWLFEPCDDLLIVSIAALLSTTTFDVAPSFITAYA